MAACDDGENTATTDEELDRILDSALEQQMSEATAADQEKRHSGKSDKKSKAKGAAVTPALKDCANCGAAEGTVPGVPTHSSCARCKITYYCSVKCQKQHWKAGGHKKKCLTPEERRAAAATETDRRNGGVGGGGGAAAEQEECAICLECLDDDDDDDGPSTTCTLPCKHRFHAQCVAELRAAGARQVCPMCRAMLPPSPEKMFDDAVTLYFSVEKHAKRATNNMWRPLNRREQQKMDEVLKLLRGCAKQGIGQAHYNIGLMYLEGKGVQMSPAQAFKSFEAAAKQRIPKAQYNLGCLYDTGFGVEQDQKKAVALYKKAAEQGLVEAQFNLACMYEKGFGVDQDQKKAVAMYKEAAMQGNLKSQYNLGLKYQVGEGVEQDNSKAFEWFQTAAKEGLPEAQFSLGIMFEQGTAVGKDGKPLGRPDPERAHRRFLKAAEHGIPQAQLKVGLKYFNGTGSAGKQECEAQAFKWFAKAAAQGLAQAKQLMDVMLVRRRQAAAASGNGEQNGNGAAAEEPKVIVVNPGSTYLAHVSKEDRKIYIAQRPSPQPLQQVSQLTPEQIMMIAEQQQQQQMRYS